MLVIKDDVAMPVQDPVEVPLKGLGMAVVGGYLQSIVIRYKNLSTVRQRRDE